MVNVSRVRGREGMGDGCTLSRILMAIPPKTAGPNHCRCRRDSAGAAHRCRSAVTRRRRPAPQRPQSAHARADRAARWHTVGPRQTGS